MTVKEALAARRSMRAFKSRPVERDKLRAILEAALRTPSWANSQPWQIVVAEGAALERVRAGYAKCYADGVPASPEVSRPEQWPEACKARQRGLRPKMVQDCGDAADQFGVLNQRMFDAPCVIFLCMDNMLGHWSLYDIGAFSQSVMLAAIEQGLGTIPAITLVNYPEVLRRELPIPENAKIVIGIAIGYADEDNAINNFRSERTPLDEIAAFCS
jgi:nitroreductase